MPDTSSPDCPCEEPVFSTTHVVLGGTALAALLGLVGYASLHNVRHRNEFEFLNERIDHLDYDVLRDRVDLLLDKQDRGTITPDEQQRLWRLLDQQGRHRLLGTD